MSVSGLCEICGQAGVEHTCDRCGSLVCDRHFEAEYGVCADCRSEIRGGRGDDRPDEGDTYRF